MFINQLSFFDSLFPVSVGDTMFIYATKSGYYNIGKFYIFEVVVTNIDFTKDNYLHENCFIVSLLPGCNYSINDKEFYYFRDINNCIFYDIDSLKKHYHIK